jgi:hypothetical protein
MSTPEQEPIPNGPLPEEEQELVVNAIIDWGNRVIEGKASGRLSDYEEVETIGPTEGAPLGEFEVEDGVIVDLNDPQFSDDNKKILLSWMEEQLGAHRDQMPIKAEYVFPDGSTRFKTFDKPFGKPDEPFYFSEWQNEGEQPSYIFWAETMYEAQEESGFEKI